MVARDPTRIPSPPGAPFPVREGNAVLPLIDGVPAFRRVCEAIEAAERSVWVTVTFLWASCRMPDGRGTPLEVLGRAAARGVDVRVVFWRPGDELANLRENAFWGAPEHLERLRREAPRVKVRWDRAAVGFCQHQKLWLVDAGAPGATAFVGGLNLNPSSMVMPGHARPGENHDLYVELTGPATADVHRAFAERWNGATDPTANDDLPLPDHGAVPAATGAARVQVQRTVHPTRSPNGRGERTILEQTSLAIGAARDTLYLEHQRIDMPEVLDAVRSAAERGVAITAVVPAADQHAAGLLALAEHPRFRLVGLTGRASDSSRHSVWVHSKLMIVDDTWASVGSANLHRFSLTGNAELNVAIWDPSFARGLRTDLERERA
jgi:phosphatidylserine/phosphatidylglycerophosphate/cardiolipin synthase-like enzyme